MTFEEKLRRMLEGYARDEHSAAEGDHLRDEDFISLIGNKNMETGIPIEINGDAPAIAEFAVLRRHLAGCDSCLANFRDFYAFFAPAGETETVAGKIETETAWQNFAPRIASEKADARTEENQTPTFWARVFPSSEKPNFAAFGWAFAALLLLLSGFSLYVAFQAGNERSQLTAELENQKQTLENQKQSYEERLKNIEQSAQTNGNLAEQEKVRLAQEKDDLQKQIAQLQNEIERTKQQRETRGNITVPNSPNVSDRQKDNSLVAVNTPIYDVFPSDAAVRSGTQSQNKFVVPTAAKSIVLILNAAGRAEFPSYQAELYNSAGKIIWRGGGLRKDNLGNFTVTLSRTALKAGNYRLRLFSGSQTIAEYPLTIESGRN